MKKKLATILTLLALVAGLQFIMAPQSSLIGQTYRILVRRGLAANLPTLAAGEFGFSTDTRELHIGSSVGNIRVQGDYITPEMYGAAGNGTSDDGPEIQLAINAAGANGVVVFSDKTYLVTTTVNLPATDLTLMGSGTAVLDTSGTNSILKQTNHGALIRIEGIKFTGGGKGIEFDCADSGSEYYEFAISNCHFAMDAGIYGIYDVGSREGTVDNCYFTTGNGIYLSHCPGFHITGGIFKSTGAQVGTAIFSDGGGSAYSSGPLMSSCIIMGYEYGVKISRSDEFRIEGCTVDYNTYNIQLLGQENGRITNSYLGSVGANPAILMADDGAAYCQNILVSNNKIVGHLDAADYDCIQATNCNNISITGNTISFFTRYGIHYTNCTYLNIINNYFAPRGGYGTNSIKATTDSSVNQIAFNTFITVASDTSYAKKLLNIGETTSGISGKLALNNGTTADYTLHAKSQATTEPAAIFAGGSAVDNNVNAGQIVIGANAAYRGHLQYTYNGGDFYFDNTWDNAGGDMLFRHRTAGTPLTSLYLSGAQNVGIGGQTTFGTNAVGAMAQKSGTAPTTSPADAYQQYSADAGAVAGQAGPHFRTEGGGIFGLRSDTGTTLQYVYQKDDLADDGTVTLPDATSGMVLVSCNAEAGMWLVQSDGAVTKISGSTNTAGTESDGNLCVYDGGGTTAIVKNMLGAAGEIRIIYYYN